MNMPRLSLWMVCALMLALAAPAAARDYVVAPNGNDANPGTLDKPMKSPVKAAKLLKAGDSLVFRGGEYKVRATRTYGLAPYASGTAGKPITFRNHDNAHVKLDLRGSDWGLTNNGYSYIVFDGLDITNKSHYGMKLSAASGRRGPGGKHILGHHITVRNCEVHHTGGECIFSQGTEYLTIENNYLHHSGRSHGLYLAAGCHNPVIRNNTSMHNQGNSGTQLNGDANADGIKNAVVERNFLSLNAQGYSLMNVKDAVFRNNVLFNNGYNGTRGSGYREVILWSKRTEKDALCRDVLFENNTLVNLVPAGHKMGNIFQVQSRTRNVTFRNNIIAIRRKGLFTFRLSVEPKGLAFENNCLALIDGGKQVAKGGTLAEYCKTHKLKQSGNIVADPMFVDMAKGDLRLKKGSPCIGAGVKGVDIGAMPYGRDIQIGCKLPWKKEEAKE
jgi:parallel beta helix pectate lyase-like protein